MKRLAAILLLVPCLLYGQVSLTYWEVFPILNFGADTLLQNPVRALAEDNDTLWAALGSGVAKSLTNSTFYHYLTTDSSFASASQNNVRDLAFDPDGDLWLATAVGIVRLNGALWASQDLFNADSGLGSNNVWRIQPDTASAPYVGLLGAGLEYFTDDTLYTDVGDSIPGTTVHALAIDSSGNIWVGTDQGAAVYMGAWFTYDTSDGLPDNQVLSIAVDGAGAIWFGTAQGAVSFDGDTTWTDHSDSIDVYGGRAVYAIAHTSTPPYVFFGTEGGIVTYKESQGVPYSPYYGYTAAGTNDSLPSDRIYDLLVTGDDTLWVATAAGLVRLVETRE